MRSFVRDDKDISATTRRFFSALGKYSNFVVNNLLLLFFASNCWSNFYHVIHWWLAVRLSTLIFHRSILFVSEWIIFLISLAITECFLCLNVLCVAFSFVPLLKCKMMNENKIVNENFLAVVISALLGFVCSFVMHFTIRESMCLCNRRQSGRVLSSISRSWSSSASFDDMFDFCV